MEIDFSKSNGALVMAHPGHELRVYHWLRLARPLCFVLTDGSGRSGNSRLDSTTRLLSQNGARSGAIYGQMTDRALYAALLKGDFDIFIKLAEVLTHELIDQEIEYVVGDAIEAYNPAHDFCRFMINAAVAKVRRLRKTSLLNFEVFLTHEINNQPEKSANDILLNLDEGGLADKLKAARAYEGIAADVDRILSRGDLEGVQTERLRSVCSDCSATDTYPETRHYEIHGEKQVAAGHYEQVLRYREHIRPIAETLRRWSCE